MLSIRKNDTVILAGGVSAKVIDIITTELINVYKIKKLTDNQILYVEDNMVRLEKQCTKNFILMISREAVNFLRYTLKLRWFI
ncbi:MAG: hypothetical protein ABIR06_07355 [Cyclobacteriaceae bacterium]